MRLDDALRAMRWREEDGRFALLGFRGRPAPDDLRLLEREPAQLVREGGQTTLLLRDEEAPAALARHPDAACERDLVWIRFEAPMAWELVGFLARVSGALAEAGVPIGVVCAFRRDHLFVAAAHRATARGVLERLFGPEERPADPPGGAAPPAPR